MGSLAFRKISDGLMTGKKIAVLDLGTNTVLLLIAEVLADGSYQVIHDEGEVVRLGEGIHHKPCFLPQAMHRTEVLLSRYRNIIDQHHCDEIMGVGTAGFRRAQNASEFCQHIQNKIGITIDIISGEEEARLIHLAARSDFPELPNPLLVLDIGGGSTEFIFENHEAEIKAVSLAFGVVRLTERFLHSDPPTTNEIQQLEKYVNGELKRLSPDIHPGYLVATAGTPTTLCALALGLLQYDASRVHGQKLSRLKIEELSKRLLALPLVQRSKLPCLPEKRADVIVAGVQILLCVMRYFGLDDVKVSDHGLRYGVLLRAIGQMG